MTQSPRSPRHRPANHLTVGEVVQRTGVPVSALHFYERKGLIFAERTHGNHRVFARHMLRRISLIIVAKRLGIPLSDVAEVFATLPVDRAPDHDDWRRVSRRWKRQLEQRRRAIEHVERELTGCIGCGCLSMKACGLLNPDDTLQARGPGPVRLNDGCVSDGEGGAEPARRRLGPASERPHDVGP